MGIAHTCSDLDEEHLRSDSGEVGSDMHVNRILAAGWSAVHTGPPADAVTINITALDSDVPLDVPSVPVEAATQYDVYCWAQVLFLRCMSYCKIGNCFHAGQCREHPGLRASELHDAAVCHFSCSFSLVPFRGSDCWSLGHRQDSPYHHLCLLRSCLQRHGASHSAAG